MPVPAEATLPPTPELLMSFGLAVGLGLLVGLQREWAGKAFAGIRTFALTALLGALSGMAGLAFGVWTVAAGFVALAALIVLANFLNSRNKPDPDLGLTTEVAMLVIYLVGVIAVLGHRVEAVVVAGSVMVLLHSKAPMHAMVKRIEPQELREISRLVLIGLVILPLLPNRDMGYLDVLNPFSIWLLVTLILGVSLGAYMLGKYIGGNKGALLAGLLGGLISSTATTASLARRSRDAEKSGRILAAVVLIASTVVFVRVGFEVAFVAPEQRWELLPPLLAMLAWGAVVAAVLYRFTTRTGVAFSEDSPPSELRGAIVFGLLYAIILVAVAAARKHLDDSGLYLAALLSGLTDMDAITLSTARLVKAGHLETDLAWRMILVGGLANLLFKGILAATLGARSFTRPILIGFGAMIAGGLVILFVWPGGNGDDQNRATSPENQIQSWHPVPQTPWLISNWSISPANSCAARDGRWCAAA